MRTAGGSLILRASRLIGVLCNGANAKGTKVKIVGVIIVFLSLVFFGSPSLAESKTDTEKQDNPHVVFSSFLASGSSNRSERVNIPVTLVFQVTKDTDT